MMERKHEKMTQDGICPRCGSYCDRDSADVGIGIIYGPYGCECGWSEWGKYDAVFGEGQKPDDDGGYTDTRGGYYPKGSR